MGFFQQRGAAALLSQQWLRQFWCWNWWAGGLFDLLHPERSQRSLWDFLPHFQPDLCWWESAALTISPHRSLPLSRCLSLSSNFSSSSPSSSSPASSVPSPDLELISWAITSWSNRGITREKSQTTKLGKSGGRPNTSNTRTGTSSRLCLPSRMTMRNMSTTLQSSRSDSREKPVWRMLKLTAWWKTSFNKNFFMGKIVNNFSNRKSTCSLWYLKYIFALFFLSINHLYMLNVRFLLRFNGQRLLEIVFSHLKNKGK